MGGFERFCWILTILASIGALAILGTALSGHGLAAPDVGGQRMPGLAASQSSTHGQPRLAES